MEKTKINPRILASEAALILNTSVQNIHKKIKAIGLPTQKTQNRISFTYNISSKLFNFSFSPTIYSTALVKGGVGKSTIALNFAIRSALLGAKVALIELDQQANLTNTCNVNAKDKPIMIDVISQSIPIEEALVPVTDGLDLLPSRVDNALLDNMLLLEKHPLDKVFFKLFSALKNTYQVIILDCPPSIGAVVSAAALASDVVIMPVNPTEYSIAGLDLTYKELTDLCSKFDKELEMKIIFNKYDARTKLSFNILSEIIQHPVYKDMLLHSNIRNNQAIENSISSGKTIFDTMRATNEKEDFALMTDELLGLLKEKLNG
jgi:chromosome partitioning protein